VTDDGEDCVEEVGMGESGVACTAVAIVEKRRINSSGKGAQRRLF
jgi:hypothetical protein